MRLRAEIDWDRFLEIFKLRADIAESLLAGATGLEKIHFPRHVTWELAQAEAPGAAASEIRREILRWWDLEEKRLKDVAEKQAARARDAESKLARKRTRAAENDLRIGTTKLAQARLELERLRRDPEDSPGAVAPGSEDAFWIWPRYRFPGVVYSDGRRWVRPFRYLFRPSGETRHWENLRSGAYNARQENLEKVGFWREVFGRQHGVFLMRRFKERQDESEADPGAAGARPPLSARREFDIDPGDWIQVPFVWSECADGGPPFFTAAAITCEPPSSVVGQGILRLPTPLSSGGLEIWERASEYPLVRHREVLAGYRWPPLSITEVVPGS
jgi:hypothetical protein